MMIDIIHEKIIERMVLEDFERFRYNFFFAIWIEHGTENETDAALF